LARRSISDEKLIGVQAEPDHAKFFLKAFADGRAGAESVARFATSSYGRVHSPTGKPAEAAALSALQSRLGE
jgi:hypothetical protein